MTKLLIRERPLDVLIPYARNARTHSEAQVAQIAASIREFGFNNPILVDGENGIIAGHSRVLAARQLGLASVPTIELSHLSETQKRAFILADNRLAELAGWDDAMLLVELESLDAAGFDVDLAGFDADDIADLMATGEDAADAGAAESADDAPIPALPLDAVTRPGDVWLLGAHRLICGDACDPTAISALMQGDLASLSVTSPPYANQRDYTSGGIADWDALMNGVFAQLPMAPDGQVLVNLGLIHRDNEFIPYWNGWLDVMRVQGWRRFGWYVWDQGPGMPGDWAGRFAPSFEFIFHFNRQARKPHKIVPCKHAGQESHLRADGSSTAMRGKDGEVGGWTHAGQPTQEMRIPDSVIRIMRHKGRIGEGIDHPAVFPVALPQFLIEAFSNAGDIVFEPFCGSGTTMLAAQRTGRVCRSVEIAPEYVDVAIQRFAQQHPEAPITLQSTGQSWSEVRAERQKSLADAPV